MTAMSIAVLDSPTTVLPSRPAPEIPLGGFVPGPYEFDNRVWTPEAMDEYEEFLRHHLAVAGTLA